MAVIVAVSTNRVGGVVGLGHALGRGGHKHGRGGREPGGDDPGNLGAFMGFAVSVGVFVEEGHEVFPDPAGVVLSPKDGGMVLVGWLVWATYDGGKDLGCLKGHLDDMFVAEHLGRASRVAVEEKDIHEEASWSGRIRKP